MSSRNVKVNPLIESSNKGKTSPGLTALILEAEQEMTMVARTTRGQSRPPQSESLGVVRGRPRRLRKVGAATPSKFRKT